MASKMLAFAVIIMMGRDGIEHTIAADFDGKPSKMGK